MMEYIKLISGSTNVYLPALEILCSGKYIWCSCILIWSFAHFTVSELFIAELLKNIKGAFGKDARYRCKYNFVHHLQDEAIKIQRIKILSEPPDMFNSSYPVFFLS